MASAETLATFERTCAAFVDEDASATRITTREHVEALAAALYMIGREEQARDTLGAFRWGSRFFELNQEPLDAYAAAKTSEELVNLQFEFFDIDRDAIGADDS